MPPKGTKKRGRPPTKKAAAKAAAPLPRNEFSRKTKAVSSIKQLLRRIERASLPARDDDTPETALEVLFTRLLTKKKMALDYSTLAQSLAGFWSDSAITKIRMVGEDLEFQQTATLFVELVRQLLEGHESAVKDSDTLSMSLVDLNSLHDWTEAVWTEVEKRADDVPASPSQLASPEPSEAGSTSRNKGKGKGKARSTSKKPVSRTYSSSSDEADQRDELDSDNDQAVAPAAAQSSKGRKKVGVKAVAVTVAKKVSAKSKTTGRKGKAASVESEDGLSRRRSTRQPAHTQTAQEAVKTKPRYEDGAILLVTIREGVKWPAAIIDEKINDGVKIHGEHYDGDYLVQLVPTRKRYWISQDATYALPRKRKLEPPSGLKSNEKNDYKTALALLGDNLRLDRWLNDRDPNQSDSDEEAGEGGELGGEEIVVDSDQEEQLDAPAPKRAKRS